MRTKIKILLLTITSVLFVTNIAKAQTLNYVPKWTPNGSTLGNSIIFDNGTNVGIGTTTPAGKLVVSKSGAEGFEFLPGYTSNSNLFQGYNRSTSLYLSLASHFLDYHFKTGITERLTINASGNVGIGITSPLAKLHMNNGSVLFDGTTGATPTSGAGTRMMWIPAKWAFRAGAVTSTQWDNGSIGNYSAAFGYNTTANGSYSAAFGNSTTASGDYSSAFGSSTIASGLSSFSSGNSTIVSGNSASAFGYNLTAQSYASFVIGQFNLNPGTYNYYGVVATDPVFVIGNGTSLTSRSNALTVLKNGNVGIGTALVNNPNSYKLAVNGTIGAKAVKVEISSTTWADYVFDEKYELKTIKELESFIKTNKHLPNVPSAEDVAKNGIDVVSMDAKLLEKIEELSLYIIQQNKRIEALEMNCVSKTQ